MMIVAKQFKFARRAALLLIAGSSSRAIAQERLATDAPPQGASTAETPNRASEQPAGTPPAATPPISGPFAKHWGWKADLKEKGVEYNLAYRF